MRELQYPFLRFLPEKSQWYYGLLRNDGTEKPALGEFIASYAGTFLASPASNAMINTTFEDLNRVTGEICNYKDWNQNWSQTD